MKYCTRCGAELVDEAVVCTGCGCSVGNKSVVGLVELVLGVAGFIYYMVTVKSMEGEFRWAFDDSYKPMMIGILIVSIIVFIVGVVTLIKANTAKTNGDIDDIDGMTTLDDVFNLAVGNSAKTYVDDGRTDYRSWWDDCGIKHESWIDADGNKHET